jgi:hypothetical protein
MKIHIILLALVIMAGCSKRHATAPASLDEFVQAFSNRYESGQTESIHKLIYDLKGSEHADTLKWMTTMGAGKLDITFMKVITVQDELPEGFDPIHTMENVEPNLEYEHVLCVKAAKDKTKVSLSWGVAEHEGHWYFPGLRKTAGWKKIVGGKQQVDPKYDELLRGKALVVKRNDKTEEVIDVIVFTADQLTNNYVCSGEPSVRFSCFGDLVDKPVRKAQVLGDPVTIYCRDGMIVGLYGRNGTIVFGSAFNNENLEKVKVYLANKRSEDIGSDPPNPQP